MKSLQRMIIYPKDVQRITGKSERYGRYLLERVKTACKKEKHQFVTVAEFCHYTGLEFDQVLFYLDGP